MPIAHLADRAVLEIGGDEARDFLQGLLTNDLTPLLTGQTVYAALLSAQGKVFSDNFVLPGAGSSTSSADSRGVWLDLPAISHAMVHRRLTMYKLRRPVTIAASPMKVFAAWGDDAPEQPGDPRLPMLGRRWLAEAAVTSAGLPDYHAHRLALGVPDSAEIGHDRTLWLEANAAELNGVSFTKGCYVGQENTARMHHRDRVRRRLLPVTLDGEPGDDMRIMAGEREAGELRGRQGALGMAWLRMELAESGTALTMNGGATGVEVRWPGWLARP